MSSSSSLEQQQQVDVPTTENDKMSPQVKLTQTDLDLDFEVDQDETKVKLSTTLPSSYPPLGKTSLPHETASGVISQMYTMKSGMTFELRQNLGITKYVFPWPRPGQKTFYLEKWRKYTDETNTRENPFAYYGSGLWWLSYVVFGADRITLQVPREKYESLSEALGWDIDLLMNEDNKPSFVGPEKVWLTDYIEDNDLPEEVNSRFNIQTMPHRLGADKVIGYLQRKKLKSLPLLVLVLYSIMVPCLWAWILYGLIPLGDFQQCGFKHFAVYLLVTNPLTEIVWAFTDLTMMFAALDPKIPWRPFWLYFPVLLFIYLAQVATFAPINLTVGTFTCQALVARALTTGICYLYTYLNRRNIFGFELVPPMFRGLTWDMIKKAWSVKADVTPEQHERWKQWLKISFWRSLLYYIYSGYTIGIKLSSGALQTILPLLLSVINIVYRKVVQHLGNPFHRDINFMVAGLALYSMSNVFLAFSTANIDVQAGAYKNNWKNYLTMFYIPLGVILKGFMHQSEIWFRFRNWIKKMYEPALMCKELDARAFGIEEEMDFDCRGSNNDHPGYRRVKFYFDYFAFWGTCTGYASYIITSWLLVIGPNKDNFPYNTTFSITDAPFTMENYYFSLIYSTVVLIIVLIAFLGYTVFIRKRFANVYPYAKSVVSLWVRYPYKLGLASLIFSACLADAISMYISFNRVWFADVGDTLGSCRGK